MIDGDGWIFYLLRLCERSLQSGLGGSYDTFSSIVHKELNLFRSNGLNVCVLFDGAKNILKEQSVNERLAQREENWETLYKYCTGRADDADDGTDFPLSPLYKEQLISTLNAFDVQHQVCISEADQEIALIVQQHNLVSTSGTKCFAYAQDSDYIAMKDCPYIEFGSIDFTSLGSASAVVWSRMEVCRALGISEEQFLDFVLFVGNDYTTHLVVQTDLRKEFQQMCPNLYSMMELWLNKVRNQRMEMVRAADFFCALPSNSQQFDEVHNLQFAMDYSRALYNLEPLDWFYEQVRSSTVPYSSASCVFDFHHYSDTSEGKFFADLDRYVKVAEKTGTAGIDRGVAVHALTYLKRRCAGTASIGEAAPVVTDEHRTAIQAMLNQLQRRETLDNCFHPQSNFSWRPEWEDAVAAYVYQKTCALMLKCFPNGAFYGAHNTPVQLFDGFVFHSVLRDMRSSTRLAAPLPEHVVSEAPDECRKYAINTESTATSCVTPPVNPPSTDVTKTFLQAASRVNVAAVINTQATGNRKASQPTVPAKALSSPAKSTKKGKKGTALTSAQPIPRLATKTDVKGEVLSASQPVSLKTTGKTANTNTVTATATAPARKKGNRKTEKLEIPTAALPIALPSNKRIVEKTRPAPAQSTKQHGNPRIEYPSQDELVYVPDVFQPKQVNCVSNSEELPIDIYRNVILLRIQRNRVTIVHGETGCGKSSRLPQFLLEDAEASKRHCKIFVSQPRRVGVVGMVKRLRPALGYKVGMRMGHGLRDETAETQLHYVTTGYLVQLMVHRPEALKRCTHVIIDEVHERSVDGDLICLLVRDLML